MRSTGSWYIVKAENGQKYDCRLRGKFKQQGMKINNPIAVGDYVTIEPEAGDATKALITEILPRENYIIRKSVHKSAFGHILAANLDQAVLVATLFYPRTSLGFIDRFLVKAESFRIPVVLVFNKTDLLEPDERAYQQELGAMYESVGYGVIETSTVQNLGIEAFAQVLENKKTLIAGHSGVGKSSLVNEIAPHLQLRTSVISDFSQKGTHTTTFAEMFEITPGTYLVDSPGIKELGMIDMAKEEISHYFPEMRDLLNACKYHNCLHVNEPQCAVIQAVDDQKIALTRYESYLSMLEDHDNRR
ncbi:MAG TPA: ribosome small subunit-dependent GTPase A [Microscillaceae bacterium]|nr:ribosome small subunit-dependent GTPase A [Microscillaceae bacterium]